MDFRTIVKLCFHFFFCHSASSSRHIFSQIKTFSEQNFDNVLEKFFIDFNQAVLQMYNPRHIMMIGASTNDLQQAHTLFESYPYIVCKETELCSQWQEFSEEAFVIVFLKDLNEETFRKYLNILSHCGKCRVLFVSDENIRIDDVWLIFTLALQYNVPYSRFVHLEKNAIELYSEFLSTNCTMEVKLVDVWRPGIGLKNINTWAFRGRDMNGCPVSVSSLTFKPKMIIEDNENGSLNAVGGSEGELLLAIASKLNFTINLRYPSAMNQHKYSRKVAIMNDVASGISEIGIGRLRPTIYSNNTIAMSVAYDEECVTWGVPRLMKWSNNIIWVEFSWKVWLLIGLVFIVSCAIRYAHRNIVSLKTGKRKNLEFVSIVLDVITLHLGSPVVHVSSSAGGRFMLICCLSYAMVITTAYKTSLASILTTVVGTSKIFDTEGIINANLVVGGSLYDYNILKDQVDGSKLTPKLLELFDINNNVSQTWNRLLFDQNYAFLARRSFLSYARQMTMKANKSVTFNVLNGCVLAYPTVMLFEARSSLIKPVNEVIQRLVESGLFLHWDSDRFDIEKLLERQSTEIYLEKRGVYKFWNIFLFYLFCISVSFLTFLIELLVPRLVLCTSKHQLHAVNQFQNSIPHLD